MLGYTLKLFKILCTGYIPLWGYGIISMDTDFADTAAVIATPFRP